MSEFNLKYQPRMLQPHLLFFFGYVLSVASQHSPMVGGHVVNQAPQQEGATNTHQEAAPVLARQQAPALNPSVVPDPTFVHFVNIRQNVRSGDLLTVQYDCSKPGWNVTMELRTYMPHMYNVELFRHTWRCPSVIGHHLTKIKLKLPAKYAYRPDRHTNPLSSYVDDVFFFVSVLTEPLTLLARRQKGVRVYDRAVIRQSMLLQLLPPHSRPRRSLARCVSWGQQIVRQTLPQYAPQCLPEPVPDVYRAVTFPIALAGERHGIHRFIPPHTNPEHELERKHFYSQPRFTIAMWVYMVEYCQKSFTRGSIFYRLTWDDRTASPILYVHPNGKLEVQIILANGKVESHSSSFVVPKHQWCLIVLSVDNLVVKISRKCGLDEKHDPRQVDYMAVKLSSGTWFDEDLATLTFGGTELIASFKGFIGEATVYRRRVLKLQQVARPDRDHRMFDSRLQDWDHRCRHYLSWVGRHTTASQQLLHHLLDKVSSHDPVASMFTPSSVIHPDDGFPVCPLFRGRVSRNYRLAYNIIRRWVLIGRKFTMKDVGDVLYSHVISIIEEDGIHSINSTLPLLKQASCYGNHDATFMLGAILNNGIGASVDRARALSYLMYGALASHRLCLLALGSKHFLGMDSVPQDPEAAYVYYKLTADIFGKDRQKHHEEDMFTEHVRLTDEKQLAQQTHEKDDLFLWFKHQAHQGVQSAQHHMARMLFWGSKGVTRDTQAALQYYRMGAEKEKDPIAMFDYGLVLLRGQGTKKNVTEGLHWLTKSADKGCAKAMNTLGWYAMEIEKNMTKAVELMEKAYELKDADAAHNLGFLWTHGKYPGKPADRIKGFQYYSFGATHHQIDSAVMVSSFHMRGSPRYARSSTLAADWARYVGEQSPALGRILNHGIKAYRNRNWASAIVFYHMAAETGLEVGTFNAGYLCEENKEGLTDQIQRECVFRFFNLSTHRAIHNVDPYSWNKMGDLYWYGCQGQRDPSVAVQMYSKAAMRGDPHAVFNLAYMVEEGVDVPADIWTKLRVNKYAHNQTSLLTALYTTCRDSPRKEAYLPCYLALWRVWIRTMWHHYKILLTCSGILGGAAAAIVTTLSVLHYFCNRRINISVA